MNAPERMTKWESCGCSGSDQKNLFHATISLHVNKKIKTGEHAMERHQINDIVGNFETVTNPVQQARIWRVADAPIDAIAPCKEVSPVRDLAPFRPRKQAVKRTVSAAWVKNSTRRRKVLNNKPRKPLRGVDDVLLNWDMKQRRLRG